MSSVKSKKKERETDAAPSTWDAGKRLPSCHPKSRPYLASHVVDFFDSLTHIPYTDEESIRTRRGTVPYRYEREKE